MELHEPTLDWRVVRYVVTPCNPRSARIEVWVQDDEIHMITGSTYFEPIPVGQSEDPISVLEEMIRGIAGGHFEERFGFLGLTLTSSVDDRSTWTFAPGDIRIRRASRRHRYERY